MISTDSSNIWRFSSSSAERSFQGPTALTPGTAAKFCIQRDWYPRTKATLSRGRVLRDAKRIVRRKHVAELVEPQSRGLHPHVQGEQPRVLGGLEPLDLQVMLGYPDPGVPGLIAEARVGSDLCQHPLEQARILPGHAALELVTPSDDAVQERVKVYRRPPAGGRQAVVGM